MRYLVLLACCMSACSGAVCRKLETRCANNVVQVCDSQGRWQKVIDCREIRPLSWECVFDGEDHTCIEVVRHETSYNRPSSQFVASHGEIASFESHEQIRF